MVTLEQLADAAGGVARGTIANYQNRGLLPKPIMRRHPGGRGMIGYWPDECLKTARDIKRWLDEGLSLDQVVERQRASQGRTVGSINETTRATIMRWRTKRIDAVKLDEELSELAREDACETLQDLYQALVRLNAGAAGTAFTDDIARDVIGDAHLAWAMELFEAGHSPVLLHNVRVGVRITTDFMLPHELNPRYWYLLRGEYPDTLASVLPYVVIPLYRLLWEIYNLDVPQWAKDRRMPQCAAPPVLYKYTDDAVIEARYTIVPLSQGQTNVAGPSFVFNVQNEALKTVAALTDDSDMRRTRKKAVRKKKS
jgi:DNA-binding transcriptional MerR regulator